MLPTPNAATTTPNPSPHTYTVLLPPIHTAPWACWGVVFAAEQAPCGATGLLRHEADGPFVLADPAWWAPPFCFAPPFLSPPPARPSPPGLPSHLWMPSRCQPAVLVATQSQPHWARKWMRRPCGLWSGPRPCNQNQPHIRAVPTFIYHTSSQHLHLRTGSRPRALPAGFWPVKLCPWNSEAFLQWLLPGLAPGHGSQRLLPALAGRRTEPRGVGERFGSRGRRDRARCPQQLPVPAPCLGANPTPAAQ